MASARALRERLQDPDYRRPWEQDEFALTSREILQFMRDLDTKEIHGYESNFGYRVYTEKAIETVGAAAGLLSNGHHPATETSKPSKKRTTKRVDIGDDSVLTEVGRDELLGERQPGDAVTAD